MQFIAASELSAGELCELWGAVYEGYPYPNTYTPQVLQRIVQTGSLDLSASALLVVEGQVAGLSGAPGEWPRAGGDGAAQMDRAHGLGLLTRLHGADLPAWQREEPSVAASEDALFLAAGEEGALAYQVRPQAVRILDMAVAPGREAAVGALLGALRQAVPAVPAVLLNEPEDGLVPALLKQGFREMDRQAEMVYSASGASPRRSFSA